MVSTQHPPDILALNTEEPMPPQQSTLKRPKPTPKQKIPGPKSQQGSDVPNQSDSANRRQTRQVTALATEQQQRTVDFVSGGTFGDSGTPGNNGSSVPHLISRQGCMSDSPTSENLVNPSTLET